MQRNNFNGEEFIQFLLDEGHTMEDIEEFLAEDFGLLLENLLDEESSKKSRPPIDRPSYKQQQIIHKKRIQKKENNKRWRKILKNYNPTNEEYEYEEDKREFRNRDIGIQRADWRLRKEEAEQVDEGLTEEMLNEIKMKLKPGQKMTPKQFAQMKADVLAKQKEKATKKAQPKPEPKEEKIETDDTNRNARILKGQFPWGTVSPELTKTAVSKLKQIPKPADRLRAMDKIWNNRKHFAALTSGSLELDKEEPKKKNNITLPKITGVS